MKKTPSYRSLFCVLALASTLAGAHAAVIYSDDFSGSSATPLLGTTTDVGGGVWAVHAAAVGYAEGWYADGSLTAGNVGTPSTSDNAETPMAYLPVTIASGNIYELSLTSLTNTNVNSWVGLVFSQYHHTPYGWNASGIDRPAGLMRSNGAVSIYPEDITTGTGFNGQSIRITLDTTGAQWTSSTYLNGSGTAASTYTYTLVEGNPTINYIGLIAENTGGPNGAATGSASNFLFQTIPEPSSVVLLGIAAGSLMLRRRRSVKVA